MCASDGAWVSDTSSKKKLRKKLFSLVKKERKKTFLSFLNIKMDCIMVALVQSHL